MYTNYITTHEIASITKTSNRHIFRLIIDEGIPFNRYHHRVVVKVSDLAAFLTERLLKINPIPLSEQSLPTNVSNGIKV